MPAVPPAMMCVAKPTGCLSLALDAMEEVEVQGIRNEECGVDHGVPGWFHMAGLSVPHERAHLMTMFGQTCVFLGGGDAPGEFRWLVQSRGSYLAERGKQSFDLDYAWPHFRHHRIRIHPFRIVQSIERTSA